jgi:hypothetical protein
MTGEPAQKRWFDSHWTASYESVSYASSREGRTIGTRSSSAHVLLVVCIEVSLMAGCVS